jgi:hypothetical protein
MLVSGAGERPRIPVDRATRERGDAILDLPGHPLRAESAGERLRLEARPPDLYGVGRTRISRNHLPKQVSPVRLSG